MTDTYFNSLGQYNKYVVIYRKAVLLAHRTAGDFHYILYQLHNFYIEVKYDLNKNEIDSLKTFIDTSSLDPYLENIKIDFLFHDN